jgi:hypothetical protein
MPKADNIVVKSSETVDHHHVLRDGSVWLCKFCHKTWPYPSALPATAGPCTPRPWVVPS